ncbi:hypothetical protein Pla108_36450 [Botrimarina colliarenosi]|uniref:DUF2314 domain-containing protein n=1 Tax=Botrimarina colliarenosi TaxID=2528001 RepID=A0A5C6A600_9BACT|nr:DUF2314 domain-containing protein [Botrimarina colliarenosi]TWT94795.1 hypothetical protein Pla108_36450 [Botrimarina colliarenosi]
MKPTALLSCLAIAFSVTGCKSNPETLVVGGYDEAEMASATDRAISEVDAFISDLISERSEHYAVKAPIEDGGVTEHFWLTGVSFSNNRFTGTIDNEPGIVSNVTMGQQYSLGKTEISDWMFIRDGKMHGNYTMRPLLATMPEAEANMYRQMFATP